MKITDRYASAVHSSNLKSRTETTFSDSDVLGAAGLAGKLVKHDGHPGAPLAIALARLFAGDNHAVREIVDLMAQLVWSKARRDGIVVLKRFAAEEMSRAVLAWHREGVCKPCGGHGYQVIRGAPALSENECPKCRGSGRRAFDSEFAPDMLDLARWLLAELERELSRAGPAAMAALAPRLDM